jgi:hypothetical protein
VIFFGAAFKYWIKFTQNPVSGMIGNIPLNATVSDQIAMQFDFRQIYSSIMQDWLCMSEAQTTNVLGGTLQN